jgi:hypothetical protein
MRLTDDYDSTSKEDDDAKDEPKIENDYTSRTEIENPNPSTATPPIPQEIPVR